MVMVTVVRIGSRGGKDLNISIERAGAHWWHEMVYGASILEIDDGVGSVGSNRFVRQNSDETIFNVNVSGAMIKSE